MQQLVRHLIDLDSFVTLCYARLDVNRRILDLVDCGHTGIVHWHGKTGVCEVLHGDNLPLGVREGEIYDQSLDSVRAWRLCCSSTPMESPKPAIPPANFSAKIACGSM